MSYCDHPESGSYINFNLGFGPQPGNVIRNNVKNALCLYSISGPSKLSDGIGIFEINDLPKGASIIWNFSDNLAYVSGQGTYQLRLRADGQGLAWVEASVVINGQSTKLPRLWVQLYPAPQAPPKPVLTLTARNSKPLSEASEPDPEYTKPVACGPVAFTCSARIVPGITQYEWTATGPDVDIEFSSTSNSLSFTGHQAGGYTVRCRQFDERSGLWSPEAMRTQNVGRCPTPAPPPDPCAEALAINAVGSGQYDVEVIKPPCRGKRHAADGQALISIYSPLGVLVRTARGTGISTRGLPAGIYVIGAQRGGLVASRTVAVE